MSDRSDGFTLIETLVALVIFAGIFAALSAGFSSGTRGLRVAQADQRALMLAKAKLATTGLESRLADRLQETGEEDGFIWRVDVQPARRRRGRNKRCGPEGILGDGEGHMARRRTRETPDDGTQGPQIKYRAMKSDKPATIRQDAGFTLLEVLISIVLLAFILVSTQTALRFGQRSWELADDLDQADRDVAAIKFIEQQLVQTMPLYEREPDGRNRVAFRGSKDSVSFIAPSGVGADGGGLYRYVLSAETLADGHQRLVLNSVLYQPLNTAGIIDTRVLLPEIHGFSLRYLGRIKPSEQPTWTADWLRTDVLPDLIEVRLMTRQRHLIKPSILQLELRLRPRIPE